MQTHRVKTHSLLKFGPNYEAVLRPVESMWKSSAGQVRRWALDLGPGIGTQLDTF